MMLLAMALVASPVPPGDATIVFFRPKSLMGAALACPVRLKGRQIVDLGRGTFARVTARPGRYSFASKNPLPPIDAKPGGTYYVRCSIKLGIVGGRASLQASDRAVFDRVGAEEREAEVAELTP
ncbi:MAG: DUF2846 domain-containing protein [Pseudomonadota bacterium]